MIDEILQIVAPHHCCGCGSIGSLLCQNCKYDIISEPYSRCVACGLSLVGSNGICSTCTAAYDRAWCVGLRHSVLEKVIDAYKFSNARAAYKPLSDLLDEHLPVLPENAVLVPIPTVNSHIRQRGYDHMLLITRRLSRERKIPIETSLKRLTATRQRDASRSLRIKQAKSAFTCTKKLDKNTIYILLDDVVTTGATLNYAAKTLKKNGARTVWAVSLSRQSLD